MNFESSDTIEAPFRLSRLSPTVSLIVEADPFDENPFIYVVESPTTVVLIDTGCGTGNLFEFVSKHFGRSFGGEQQKDAEVEYKLHRRLIVVNTHNHYDHVGGNYLFSPGEQSRDHPARDSYAGVDGHEDFCPKAFRIPVELCMGSAARSYSLDLFNSLGPIVGCNIRPYHVTRWLGDNDVISLEDEETTTNGQGLTSGGNGLTVVHTPGHTPDSICLWYPMESRMFVGDFIYRYADIMAIGVESSSVQYETSCLKLIDLIETLKVRTDREYTKIKLCCGHKDDSLNPEYLSDLRMLLRGVNGGTMDGGVRQGGTFCWPRFKAANRDISFVYRKGMWFDFLVKPVAKLFCRIFR